MTKELRFYVLDTQDINIDKGFEELTDKEWIEQCERQGRVYTLNGFIKAFNEEEITTSIDVVSCFRVDGNQLINIMTEEGDLTMERQELIDICLDAVVPFKEWNDRDSYSSQVLLESIYQGLKAGVDYTVKIEGETIWIYFEEPTEGQRKKLQENRLDIDSRDDYIKWYLEEYGDECYPEMFDGYGINWDSPYRGGYLPTRERLNYANGGDWY